MSYHRETWKCPKCGAQKPQSHKVGCTYCRCPHCDRTDGTHGPTCARMRDQAAKEATERRAQEALPKRPLHFNAQGFFQGDVNAKDAREQFQILIRERMKRDAPGFRSSS